MDIKLEISEDYEGFVRHELFIDNRLVATIGALYDCPEDAIVGRDLIDGEDIIKYIKMGYDAASNGEILLVERYE